MRKVTYSIVKQLNIFFCFQDNTDKQWKEYTHDPYNNTLYNGYGMDEYGYGNGSGGGGGGTSKSNSLHKNYRGSTDRSQQFQHYPNSGEYHNQYQSSLAAAAQYNQSLERRQYEQQLQHQHHQHQNQHHSHQHSAGRRSHNGGGGPYEINDRHQSNKYVQQHQQQQQHQMQPDFYFMPHQRKYSSDVVRVFVDYDHN